MNKSQIIDFLKQSINKEYILKCFVFGSIAKGIENPNDCDLFIVTNQTPFKKEWKQFLNEIEQLQESFELKFGLKLNTTINTEKEFSEYSAFKERILNRPTININ